MGVFYHNQEPLGSDILDYSGRKEHKYHFIDFHQVLLLLPLDNLKNVQ